MREFLQSVNLTDIVVVLVIIILIVCLIKKAVKLAIGVVLIFFIFQIGFMLNGDEINEKFGLNKYLNPEAAATVTDFFNDFASRRDEMGIVDTDKVYEGMVNTANEAYETTVKFFKENLTKENLKKFSDALASELHEAGFDDITLEDLVGAIADKLKTTPDDPTVQTMALSVKESLDSINNAK